MKLLPQPDGQPLGWAVLPVDERVVGAVWGFGDGAPFLHRGDLRL